MVVYCVFCWTCISLLPKEKEKGKERKHIHINGNDIDVITNQQIKGNLGK